MAVSQVTIWNRALQKLGAKRVSSTTTDTVSGRACQACYDSLLEAELRKHPWNFAIKRAQLAADADAPEFGRSASFPLPSDFLRLIRPYPEQNSLAIDYVIEAEKKIVTNLGTPLNIRYIAKITDPNKMDSLFREALAAKMAIEMCEELSQSSTKKESLKDDYTDVIREARRANAFDKVAMVSPTDEWIEVRSGFMMSHTRPYQS